ncbi:hypothetical protein [Phyllobacterium sp. 22552]|uniref:hypothetical protein n=1 Tax=Phyllobacterium sp. 22552 TaxID=3453941 RepID=UPI003F854DF3
MSGMVTITPSERFTPYTPVVPTTAFPVNFPIFDPDDVKLLLNGEEVTGITVTATFIEGIATDAVVNVMGSGIIGEVIVVGVRMPRRTDQYQAGRPLTMGDHNYSLNRLTIENQEQRRDLSRSLKLSIGAGTIPDLPTAEAGKVLGWNSDGTAIVNRDAVSAGAAGAAGAAILMSETVEQVRDYLDLVPGLDVQEHSDNLDIFAGMELGAAGLANLLAENYTEVLATPVNGTVTDAKLASALSNSLVTVCASAAAAKAVDTTRYTMLFRKSATSGASRMFGWRTGDYTARIAADTTGAIFFKADAIAASAGAWVALDGGWALGQFDPLWFGAVPDWDGSTGTDNAAAFNAIYAMRTVLPLMNIKIGAGAYRFASRLSWAFTSGQHCTITGAGWDVTQLVWNIASGGIAISYEGDVRQNGSSLKISDFAIITNQAPASAGTALQITNTPFAEGMTQPGPTIQNVMARGYDSTFGWGKGFDFVDCCSTKVSNCWALGKASDYTMIGFDVRGGALNRWSDHTFEGCRAYWYDKAVRMANLGEGIVIDKGLFVAGRVGVFDAGEADRPLHLSVTNTHVNADTAGIQSFGGGAQALLSGNLIYEWVNNTGAWAGISLADYTEVTVTGNQITAWPLTRTKVGIQLGNVTRGLCTGNMVRGVTDPLTKGIVTSGTNVIVDGNLYSNCTVRNDNSATQSYTCSEKSWGSVDVAFTGNASLVANVPHNMAQTPNWDRITVSARFVSGAATLTVNHIGAPTGSVVPVAFTLSGFVSSGTARINVKCEKE